MPLVTDQIGCNDRGMAVVALLHQFEEDVALLRFQGQISNFVNKCLAEHLLTNVKLSEMWS